MLDRDAQSIEVGHKVEFLLSILFNIQFVGVMPQQLKSSSFKPCLANKWETVVLAAPKGMFAIVK